MRKLLQGEFSHNLSLSLTHSDSGVHAESLHQHIVEDDGQQGHQDVCETHVKHDGRPWNTHTHTRGGELSTAGEEAEWRKSRTLLWVFH